jgi:hypothetical protein
LTDAALFDMFDFASAREDTLCPCRASVILSCPSDSQDIGGFLFLTTFSPPFFLIDDVNNHSQLIFDRIIRFHFYNNHPSRDISGDLFTLSGEYQAVSF